MALKTHFFDQRLTLDKYDQKILHKLIQNFRYPRKKLAHELKISQQKVLYRISRLKKELIQPTLILDYPLLKLETFVILVEDLSQADAQRLKQLENLYLMVHLIGRYQYALIVVEKDVNKFCYTYLSNSRVEIYPITQYEVDNYNPYGFAHQEEPPKTRTTFTLDNLDYRILYHLCKDPELSNFRLGQIAKIDRRTVAKRIQKLLETGVIQRFRYDLSIPRSGMSLYFLKIQCKPKVRKQVITSIKQYKYSGFIHHSNMTIFNQQAPEDYKDLFHFIEGLKNIDTSVTIEVMQVSGDHIVDSTPPAVLEYFKSKS